ncbi:MAG: NUDIX hydrolase [Spirochaetaceae bacterium]|mgnify:CR=1 FL=1|jgi:8-oxo-dGTP diphosphatase|nr:NUDIX hydrolase [Spirochaetaceae bacterium]|tara:strand:+ start:12510 stop:12938 length:429 start_codon:yes stop_codon:yes gene_type:complete
MEYRNPVPTVDLIIRLSDGIVLIERKNPPHGYALPGGFVDEWEPVEKAAIREAREETGLHITLDELFYVYSDPARDPRRHTMSVVFLAHADQRPVAGDDAAAVVVVAEAELQSYELAFDHSRIIQEYLEFRKTGIRPLHSPE